MHHVDSGICSCCIVTNLWILSGVQNNDNLIVSGVRLHVLLVIVCVVLIVCFCVNSYDFNNKLSGT